MDVTGRLRPRNPRVRSCDPQRGRADVDNLQLINISDTASKAFGSFDWAEHEGKGVRLFVQVFG